MPCPSGRFCFSTPGPFTLAVKVAGVTPWIHHMRVKTAYDTDPENAEWAAQRGPLTLERLRSSLRRRRKRRSRTSPFRRKPHNQLLLLGLINVILNLTSVSTQDNVFISWAHSYVDFHNTCTAGYVGLCLCLWWMDFLGGCHRSAKILNHSVLF